LEGGYTGGGAREADVVGVGVGGGGAAKVAAGDVDHLGRDVARLGRKDALPVMNFARLGVIFAYLGAGFDLPGAIFELFDVLSPFFSGVDMYVASGKEQSGEMFEYEEQNVIPAV
jgi:hypothetical protein